MAVARGKGKREKQLVSSRYRVSVLQDDIVLEIVVQHREYTSHHCEGWLKMVKILNFILCVFTRIKKYI